MVVAPLLAQYADFPRLSRDVHLADHLAVDAFDEGLAAVEVLGVLDLTSLIVFRGQVEGLGLRRRLMSLDTSTTFISGWSCCS